MKMRHTPPKWIAYETTPIDDKRQHWFVGSNNRSHVNFCGIAKILKTGDYKEDKANARLMSAAPELLAACIKYVEKNVNKTHPSEDLAQMRDAIEKAIGDITNEL